MASWVTHLPGCPQLEEVGLAYDHHQHASAHPSAVARLLARHNPRLRVLWVWCKEDADMTSWDAAVEGLPEAAAAGGEAVTWEWFPSDSLAALKRLEYLDSRQLDICDKAAWQHMAALTALTQLLGALFQYAPPLAAGPYLSVLVLSECEVYIGGYDMGRLLLACPQLETAELTVNMYLSPEPVVRPHVQLTPHPKLKTLVLRTCNRWGTGLPAEVTGGTDAEVAAAAAAATAAAVTQFRALAPVLQGVLKLSLHDWPTSSSSGGGAGSSSSGRGDHAKTVLPDLSPCTALTALEFGSPEEASSRGRGRGLVEPEQEEYACMLAPLMQLQRVQLCDASRVNARVALALQAMLPQLQRVELLRCGELLPEGSEWRQEVRALDRLKQLLRPGLVLEVDG
jgi:hypothetical protein